MNNEQLNISELYLNDLGGMVETLNNFTLGCSTLGQGRQKTRKEVGHGTTSPHDVSFECYNIKWLKSFESYKRVLKK